MGYWNLMLKTRVINEFFLLMFLQIQQQMIQTVFLKIFPTKKKVVVSSSRNRTIRSATRRADVQQDVPTSPRYP